MITILHTIARVPVWFRQSTTNGRGTLAIVRIKTNVFINLCVADPTLFERFTFLKTINVFNINWLFPFHSEFKSDEDLFGKCKDARVQCITFPYIWISCSFKKQLCPLFILFHIVWSVEQFKTTVCGKMHRADHRYFVLWSFNLLTWYAAHKLLL